MAMYRALVRWGKATDGVPFTLRSCDVQEPLPQRCQTLNGA